MARMNQAAAAKAVFTHGGQPAYPHLKPIQALRRSVLACMLWENGYYESGVSVADRIAELAAQVTPRELADLAIEARTVHSLRHVSLLLLCALAKRGGRIVGDTIAAVVSRADEPAELLALYWKDGKQPISKQMKLGLARAIRKFNAYQLAKYNRDSAIKLRDVLFLVHAKPKDDAQAEVWKQLIDGTLPIPDTWEVALSSGADKRATWERMLREGSLGYFALIRNLRNMTAGGVDAALIRDAIVARKGGAEKVLPFRYVAAARACPQMEPALDQALCEAISELPPLTGRTLVLVDVSGSMDAPLSGKSDMKRIDAAAALASLIHGDLRVFSFSHALVEVPPRRGMAGIDAVIRSQQHGGTALAGAVAAVNAIPHDRLIVITDEQATDGRVPDPVAKHAYMVNVASNQNGVGYGRWTHLDGFSEGILRWIHAHEADDIG